MSGVAGSPILRSQTSRYNRLVKPTSGWVMLYAISGLALVALGVGMVRIARPGPDGTVVWFLRRYEADALYALVATLGLAAGFVLLFVGLVNW